MANEMESDPVIVLVNLAMGSYLGMFICGVGVIAVSYMLTQMTIGLISWQTKRESTREAEEERKEQALNLLNEIKEILSR